MNSYKNKIPAREEFHRHFAGELCTSDFNTDTPPQITANRILSANTFDDHCRQRAEERKRRENCHQ